MVAQIDAVNQNPSEEILKTKLTLPQIRPDLVFRSHLLQQLVGNVQKSTLTLVSAPAGSGKSTLLSVWGSAGNAGMPVAWVSLEERDNVSARFWTYVIAALRAFAPECGEEALALLRLPQPPDIESVLVALINTLTDLPHPLALVLDDYHLITSTTIHNECLFLLDHLPPQIHIIMSTREDPALPLHRLRARGQLRELRAADLRFTHDEVAIFLQQTMHLTLSPEDIAALEARTEGWIAGLQLAALSMQGQVDGKSFIASLTGNHRFILDYLAKEVFQQQSEEMQEFLLRTSVLDRLTASLCNAITGRADAQAMLECMEQANLFLISLDHERRWYRYHHLFAAFLQDRLRQTSPHLLPELHQRAGIWCEDNGLIAEAIDHALQAGLFDHAAQLIESAAKTLWRWQKTNTLMKYLEALPVDLARSRPRLSIYLAWASMYTDEGKCSAWLRYAEHQLRRQKYSEDWGTVSTELKQMLGEIFTIRTFLASRQSNVAKIINYCQRANELLAKVSPLRGPLKYLMAYVSSSTGDDDTACRFLEEGIVASKAAGNDLYVANSYVYLVCLQISRGQMRQAAATCQQALAYSTVSPTGQILLTGAAYFSLYELHYEWNNLEEAQRFLEKALDYAKRAGDSGLEAVARLLLPALLFAQGQREQAFQAFEEHYSRLPLYPRDKISMVARDCRVRFWLEAGDVASAARWAQEYVLEIEDERDPLYVIERAALAHVYLAQGKADEALRLLERAVVVSKQTGRIYYLLCGMSLQALALHAQHDTYAALKVLAEALALGEPEGIVRVFADCGQQMAELLLLLLESAQQSNGASRERCSSRAYILKLLAALNFQPSAREQRPAHPPVSSREIEVLRLIAGGYSSREIAQRLVISEGTVKTHMKRIYAKLEVNSRTQAIARARVWSLL